MKTIKNLANLTLMSIVAVVTISFTACSDNDIVEDQLNTNVSAVDQQNDQLLEPYGLVYTDFIERNDVKILNGDTTLISISKAYADKMGYSNFVNHPMGIWDEKEHAAYLRRATEQKLIDERYVLKVVPSSIGEVVGNRDVTLSTHPYYNPNAGTTRSGSLGISEFALRCVDENNVIHPAAITLYPSPDDLTRGSAMDCCTFTVEEIYNGAFETRGSVGDWVNNRWNDIKDAMNNVANKVDKLTSYDVNCPKKTVGLLHHKSKFEKKVKIESGSKKDYITVNMELPVQFNLDYTLEVRGHGSIKTAMLPKPDYLETYADGYFELNPKMTLEAFGKMEVPKDKQSIKLVKFPSIGATFIIGVVPVHVTFEPNIHLQLKASIEGKLQTSINYDFATKFRAGVKYSGGWSGISNGEIVKNEFKFNKPKATFKLGFNPGLMFGVDIIVNKVAGPTIAMGPRIDCTAELSNTRNADSWDFKAKATAGFGGEFGAKVKVFGWDLAEWKYPFNIGTQKTIFEYPKAN